MGAQFTLGRIAEALGATLKGDPAHVIREALLPDLLRRFRALEQRVRELEGGRHA